MSNPLQPGSWRPELLVDDRAFRLYDPTTKTLVGFAGPLGRERVLSALPTTRVLDARDTEITRR